MTFHAPNKYRVRRGPMGTGDDMGNYGFFLVPNRYRRDMPLRVISSGGETDIDREWEHVSVSYVDRCPTWLEMCLVKSLFWDDEDAVIQLHPPRSTWVNNHEFCLHLWRPVGLALPLPPSWMVGNAHAGPLPL
jgi:hypothetical protein